MKLSTLTACGLEQKTVTTSGCKNIYLGETRIATRLNMEKNPSTGCEAVNTYYYHPDHLGSSNIVTTPDGEVFEHIEYTPYGETWIEKSDDDLDMLNYKFTGKQVDDETGLYYYGARCLNPRTSRWISSDPAGWELINPMGSDGEPRSGYSIVEANNWYSYTSNNPVNFIYPTGMWTTKEIFLSYLYPFQALKVRDNAEKAKETTAENKDHDSVGSKTHNGSADAFRHAYWNALNAGDIGKNLAKEFGDAHEADPKQPDAEREMDLFNNEIGRKIGIDNPDATDAELVDLVIEALDNKKLMEKPSSSSGEKLINTFKTLIIFHRMLHRQNLYRRLK